MSQKLIVGLGNPGKEYSANRHNIGFLCLNYFAKKEGIEFDKKQAKARVGKGRVEGTDVLLAKPQTYMNASGEAVYLLVQKLYLGLDDLIVVHDDLDLPLGKIRIKCGSSAGGHNGIKSIIASLGSQDFARIRVGIGRPENPGEGKDREVVDYVLGDFSRQEKALIHDILKRVNEGLLMLVKGDLQGAMNKYNGSTPA